jgi:hypothetical protein
LTASVPWLLATDVSGEILITAGIALASLLVATWQTWMLGRSEQLRTQPIVLVGEASQPRASQGDDPSTVELFVRNDGTGSAFGVTFGVLADERHDRCRPSESGPKGPGNLPRVLGAGARAPAPPGSFLCELPFDPFASGELAERVYWCRFKNAFGREWETRNSSAEAKPLEIIRIRHFRPRAEQPSMPLRTGFGRRVRA